MAINYLVWNIEKMPKEYLRFEENWHSRNTFRCETV